MDLRRIERGKQRVLGRKAAQARGIRPQTARLFLQAERNRRVPADVGPAIHVIADPGGKTERQRAEIEPAARPALMRMGQQGRVDAVARGACPLDRVADLAMLEFERDRGRLCGHGANGCSQRIVGQRGAGHGIGLRRIEQERGMRGKDRVEQRLFPAGAELAEAVFLVEEGGNTGQVLVRAGRREPAQARGTALQRLALQLGDEALHVVERSHHFPARARDRGSTGTRD
jgi:hypothetical protein